MLSKCRWRWFLLWRSRLRVTGRGDTATGRDARPDVQQAQKQANIVTNSQQPAPSPHTQQKTRSSGTQKKKGSEKKKQQPVQQFVPNSLSEPEQILPPVVDLDDDEP
jgi:hypothetical protein